MEFEGGLGQRLGAAADQTPDVFGVLLPGAPERHAEHDQES